jgi:hypothetical protein
MRFDSHEPPVLAGNKGMALSRDQTKAHGLVFDHMAYVTEPQLIFKERFYGYRDAVAHWKRLQANKQWPVHLNDYLGWVEKGVMADKIPAELVPN